MQMARVSLLEAWSELGDGLVTAVEFVSRIASDSPVATSTISGAFKTFKRRREQDSGQLISIRGAVDLDPNDW